MSFGYQILGFGGGESGLTYMDATGGTITEDGDYKIHTFTSPGTFTVVAVGEVAVPATYRDQISYMVIAGGGASGSRGAGGGGGGGWRANNHEAGGEFTPESPLAAPVSSFTVSASPGSYPITVGSGGPGPGSLGYYNGPPGGSSSAFSITSAGGGGGGYNNGPVGTSGLTGGSGGGGGNATSAGGPGPGNNPPTSPPQGNAGGAGVGTDTGSGGGAGGAGSATWPATPGPGTPHGISGADVTYSSGGNPGQPADYGNGQGFSTPSGAKAGNDGAVMIRYRVAGKP